MDEPFYESPWSGVKDWWVLNPGPFIDICFDLGIKNYVFTEKVFKFAPNMRLAPNRLLESASRGRPWRAILVEADYGLEKIAQVAVEYTSESGFESYVGVYPVWSAKNHTLEELYEKINSFEPGRSIGRFFGDALDMRIVEGQQERVLVKNPPMAQQAWNEYFLELSRAKRIYPDVLFHIHGGKNLSRGMGTGVDSFDHPVRTRWIGGFPNILLPNGQEVGPHSGLAKDAKMWSNFIGLRIPDVYAGNDLGEIARRAYDFSLRSIKWATNNYEKVWTPGRGGLAAPEDFDHESSDDEWQPIQDLQTLPKHLKRDGFNMWLCSLCSLAVSCPYARPGAVCIVEDSTTAELAKKFRSRRSTDIIEGLGALIGANVDRLQRGMMREIEDKKIDPAVTKLVDSIFDRGVQLAKMVDPAMAGQLSGGTKVNVGVITPGMAGRVTAATAQELMAGVVKALEAEGISVEDATPDDVERILARVPDEIIIPEEDSDASEDP